MHINHPRQLLFLKHLGHFRAKRLDKQGPIAFKVIADTVACAWHIEADATEKSAWTRRQDDHSIHPTAWQQYASAAAPVLCAVRVVSGIEEEEGLRRVHRPCSAIGSP
jgi:hypothetical protein